MRLLFSLLAVVTACSAQCMVRTLLPMTYVEQCSPYGGMSMSGCSSVPDDLSALLSLARALNNDKGEKPAATPTPTTPTNHCHTINVDDIITKLLNALLYATCNKRSSQTESQSSGGSGSSSSSAPQNEGHHKPQKEDMGQTPPTKPSQPAENDSNGALIDLDLLDDDSILELDVAGDPIIDVNVGGDNIKEPGLVGGLLDGLL